MNDTQQRVRFASADETIAYEDTTDHFENGLLRLMNLTEPEFERWIELAQESQGDLLERLRQGWRGLRKVERPAGVPSSGPVESPDPARSGRLWHPSIAESPDYGVAIDDDTMLGWLVRWDGRQFARERRPPTYEQEYFEGNKLEAGGYGDYAEQSGWRLEKAHRQVDELQQAGGIGSGRVLDVGSGYGYFRVALEQAGFAHDGVEVSEFACRVAEHDYGFETFRGTLDDHWHSWHDRYDAITGFDLIEHVEDPAEFMRRVASCLRPGGVVGLKTPNTDCPEAELFGAHYHSLKREHLWFFSLDSLGEIARSAGLEQRSAETISHLLEGFVGASEISRWQREGRGADLSVWFVKPG